MALELGGAFSGGLLGGGLALASATVVTLYLLRVRRRRLPVAFVALWRRVLSESQRTAWWRNLRRLFSLLIQLVILALLFGSLAEPKLGQSATDRNLVLVIDASASMQTKDVDGKTRFAVAIAAAEELVDSLGGADRAALIVADHHPRATFALGADRDDLRRALSQLQPSDTPLDAEAAFRLAHDLLLGQPNPHIVLFTDGALSAEATSAVYLTRAPPPDSPSAIDLRKTNVSAVVVGARDQRATGNVGITAFSARRYRANQTAYEVLLELGSSFDTEKSVEIELIQAGETIAVEKLDIPPHGHRQRLYSNLAGTGQELEARIKTAVDALPIDDHAYALLPTPRPLRLLVVSPGNLFVEGALLLEQSLTIARITPDKYSAGQAAKYDAVVFDGFTPPELPPAHALYLAPTGPGSPFAIRGTLGGPIITDVAKDHPLMKWIDLKDLNIASATSFTLGREDVALAKALRDPILVAGTRGGRRYIAIGFDVRKSDWPLRVAFPVFIVNALSWWTAAGSTPATSLRTGVVEHVAAHGQGGSAVLADPTGGRRSMPIVDGHVALVALHAGFSRLTFPQKGSSLEVAASLLSDEETLTQRQASLTIDSQKLATELPRGVGIERRLWPLFVLLALLIALFEWWTYHRRVTV